MKKLLLLHGALGAESHFSELKKELQGKYELHSLNFEGHGGRASQTVFSLELFARNVLDYLREHEITSCSVFGYSMGGYVALKLAADHPGLLSEIVTLGTKFDWSPETAEREVALLNPEKIEAKVPHFAAALASLHAPLDWKELMHKTGQFMLDLGKNPVLSPALLKQIKIPVTLLLGSKDTMVSVDETAMVQQLLPNARMESVEGWPHPIERINARELALRLTEILD